MSNILPSLYNVKNDPKIREAIIFNRENFADAVKTGNIPVQQSIVHSISQIAHTREMRTRCMIAKNILESTRCPIEALEYFPISSLYSPAIIHSMLKESTKYTYSYLIHIIDIIIGNLNCFTTSLINARDSFIIKKNAGMFLKGNKLIDIKQALVTFQSVLNVQNQTLKTFLTAQDDHMPLSLRKYSQSSDLKFWAQINNNSSTYYCRFKSIIDPILRCILSSISNPGSPKIKPTNNNTDDNFLFQQILKRVLNNDDFSKDMKNDEGTNHPLDGEENKTIETSQEIDNDQTLENNNRGNEDDSNDRNDENDGNDENYSRDNQWDYNKDLNHFFKKHRNFPLPDDPPPYAFDEIPEYNFDIRGKVDSKFYTLAVLLAGLTPYKAELFLGFLGIKTFSSCTLYDAQKTITPIITDLASQSMNYQFSKMGPDNIMRIDGSWSHARHAKQATATIMNKENKIVWQKLVYKSYNGLEGNIANDMASRSFEMCALREVSHELVENERWSYFVSDRDGGIWNFISSINKGLIKCCDPGHGLQSIKRAFTRLNTKYKVFEPIREPFFRYVRSVVMKEDDRETRIALFRNVLDHYSGNHTNLCCHPEKECKVFFNESNLNTFRIFRGFIESTSELIGSMHPKITTQPVEAFHHARLFYAPKDYAWRTGYIARNALAVLTNNEKYYAFEIWARIKCRASVNKLCICSIINHANRHQEFIEENNKPEFRMKLNKLRYAYRKEGKIEEEGSHIEHLKEVSADEASTEAAIYDSISQINNDLKDVQVLANETEENNNKYEHFMEKTINSEQYSDDDFSYNIDNMSQNARTIMNERMNDFIEYNGLLRSSDRDNIPALGVGLKNSFVIDPDCILNNCWANSALQALIHVPQWLINIIKADTQLSSFVKAVCTSDRSTAIPFEMLTSEFPPYIDNHHGDCRDAVYKLLKAAGMNPYEHKIVRTHSSLIRCPKCGGALQAEESAFQVEIEMAIDEKRLRVKCPISDPEIIGAEKKERLSALINNKLASHACVQCHQDIQIDCTLDIPDLLLVHVERSFFDADDRSKIIFYKTEILPPTTLHIDGDKSDVPFCLRAIVVHSGDHYYTLGIEGGPKKTMFVYDDLIVTNIDKLDTEPFVNYYNEVLSNSELLIYSREVDADKKEPSGGLPIYDIGDIFGSS